MESDEHGSPGDLPDDAIRGEVRQSGYRRVSHGLFLPMRPGLSAGSEFRRDLLAWLHVLPPRAVFTHVTGARLLGWQLPQLPEQVPVFAAVEENQPRPRRPGLICSRLRRLTRPDTDGIPIEWPEEILLRASRDLGTLDVTIMLDSARRRGHIDPERLAAVLSSGRPGVTTLRRSWLWSTPKADSGPETVLRVFHEVLEVPVEPQAVLVDGNGHIVGQADLLVSGTPFVHEYDGAHHRDKRQQSTDLRRARGLGGASYERRGFTLDDLINHPLVAMHEIDRALGRPHRLARLTRWRRLVENSMFSATGRRRVLNRWARRMGAPDWSRTA